MPRHGGGKHPPRERLSAFLSPPIDHLCVALQGLLVPWEIWYKNRLDGCVSAPLQGSHSRGSGNPVKGAVNLDPRLRGGDIERENEDENGRQSEDIIKVTRWVVRPPSLKVGCFSYPLTPDLLNKSSKYCSRTKWPWSPLRFSQRKFKETNICIIINNKRRPTEMYYLIRLSKT